MPIFKHILVPTDFSEFSQRAQKLAVDMTLGSGADLTVMHTCEIPVYAYSDMAVPPIDLLSPVVEIAEKEVTKDIRNRFAHRGLSGTFHAKDVAVLVDCFAFAHSHPRHSRRRNFLNSADRLVRRLRTAKRLVLDMHSGELSFGDLRVLFSELTVIPPIPAKSIDPQAASKKQRSFDYSATEKDAGH
jgi:nucleotide-binding universal stress UspA family protein